MLPHISMQELNQNLSIITRVVIHPKYRTIGLGAKIIRETLSSAGTPYVEMVAVMAKYNPFAEKAGLQKVTEQKPLESVLEIAKLLSKFEFELPLLSSERYALERLKRLSPAEGKQLKELFAKNKHPRFKKEFAVSQHQPFGKASDYVRCIENADSAKIAKLIKLVGMLLQTRSRKSLKIVIDEKEYFVHVKDIYRALGNPNFHAHILQLVKPLRSSLRSLSSLS